MTVGHTAVDSENPLVNRRVGCLQQELEAIHAKSETRMAGASEGMSSVKTEPQESEVLEVGMMGIKSKDSLLLVLPIATSRGVLHLVGRDKTPNLLEQFNPVQDNDKEMADAP
jgi:hypothetical protein